MPGLAPRQPTLLVRILLWLLTLQQVMDFTAKASIVQCDTALSDYTDIERLPTCPSSLNLQTIGHEHSPALYDFLLRLMTNGRIPSTLSLQAGSESWFQKKQLPTQETSFLLQHQAEDTRTYVVNLSLFGCHQRPYQHYEFQRGCQLATALAAPITTETQASLDRGIDCALNYLIELEDRVKLNKITPQEKAQFKQHFNSGAMLINVVPSIKRAIDQSKAAGQKVYIAVDDVNFIMHALDKPKPFSFEVYDTFEIKEQSYIRMSPIGSAVERFIALTKYEHYQTQHHPEKQQALRFAAMFINLAGLPLIQQISPELVKAWGELLSKPVPRARL